MQNHWFILLQLEHKAMNISTDKGLGLSEEKEDGGLNMEFIHYYLTT
jgi:hypothetical protein